MQQENIEAFTEEHPQAVVHEGKTHSSYNTLLTKIKLNSNNLSFNYNPAEAILIKNEAVMSMCVVNQNKVFLQFLDSSDIASLEFW